MFKKSQCSRWSEVGKIIATIAAKGITEKDLQGWKQLYLLATKIQLPTGTVSSSIPQNNKHACLSGLESKALLASKPSIEAMDFFYFHIYIQKNLASIFLTI